MFNKQEPQRKSLKSTFKMEDIRRKQLEQAQTLRNIKKEDAIQKRRKEVTQLPEKLDVITNQKLQGIPKMVEALISQDKKAQLDATVSFRKLLSMGILQFF